MKVVKWILAIFVASGFAISIQAQESQEAQKAQEQVLQEAIRDTGSVNLQKQANVPIKDVMANLAKQAHTNILVDPKTISDKDVVDVPEFNNVPFREVLEAILKVAGLVIESETPELIKVVKPPTVSIDLSNASIVEVIGIISKISGTDIVIGRDVQGTITLNVRNKPWMDVLDTVVNTAGYIAVREKSGIIRITNSADLRSQLETKIFKLKYIQPPPIFKATMTGTAQVIGAPRATANQTDPNEFTLLRVLRAASTRDTQGNVLQGATIDFDLDSNSVIATDTKPGLDRIEAMINKLDVEPQEIIIDVRFVTTNNNNILNYGVSWSSGIPGELTPGLGAITQPLGHLSDTDRANVTGNTLLTSPPAIPVNNAQGVLPPFTVTRLPFGLLGFDQGLPGGRQYFLTNYGVQAIMRLLKNDIYSRIEHKPTVAVLDNTAATIFVGESIPFAQATQSAIAGSTAVTTTLAPGSGSPVNVGFQLMVIPRIIANENRIILTVIPQNQFLSGSSTTRPGFETFTSGGQSIDLPRISNTTAVTKLMIDDGLTAILGGLYTATTAATETKVPFLGDIPIIGQAFKNKQDTDNRRQLYIFITPRIVKGSRLSAQELNSLLRQRLEQERKMLEERKKVQEESQIKGIQEKRSKESQKELEELKK